MKKILFRTEGGPEIGLGHLVRCIAMAQMLSDYEIFFVCNHIPSILEGTIKSLGYKLLKIDKEEYFLNQLNGSEIIVIDHYGFDSNYQKEVKKRGCSLVCIDDLNDKVFYADLIINHAPYIAPTEYTAQPYTKFALGIEYALLRPAFLLGAREPRITEEIKTIFVCFGGSDPKNLTFKILEETCRLREKNIIVITGNAYQHLDRLHDFVIQNENIQHFHDVSEQDMARLMKLSDLAIVPASGILFEALSLGCNIITSYYIDNQKAIFNGFKKLKSAYFLDNFDQCDKDFLEQFIDNYKPETYSNLIDGHSNLRIKKLIDQLK